MQDMIQNQIQQQLNQTGLQGMHHPPQGPPHRAPHHPHQPAHPAHQPAGDANEVEARLRQMASYVNAATDGEAGAGGVGLVVGVAAMPPGMGGMDLGALGGMLAGGVGYAGGGGYVAEDNEVGFIEGFLLVMSDHLPSGDLFSLVRGDVAGLQGLQSVMSHHLVEDLLGAGFDHQDLADCAEEVADSLIDGITFDDLIKEDDEMTFPDVPSGEDGMRALHARVNPGVNIDKLLKMCLTQHSRLFLNLVTSEPVPPSETNPYPFSMGLRRWLSWMLGDMLRQLTDSFQGGRPDALLFMRNFITVRLAHGTASLSARGLGAGPGGTNDIAFLQVGTERLIDDMIALIDTHNHETGRS